jgi:hypothetical protein
MLALIQAFAVLGASECLAQRNDTAVISATLAGVYEMLQRSGDADIRGPIAFDPRVLRADRGPPPRAWPDSEALRWVGDVSDSVMSSQRVRVLLEDANLTAKNVIRWVACGIPESGNCGQSEFSAVVAVSEPWICGDVAQVLASIRYNSTDDLHPSAWQASVLRLRRVNGRWTPGEWYNQASN